MKKIIIFTLVVLAGFQIYNKQTPQPENSPEIVSTENFSCDGRVWCSEMTSCDEAKYFIRNCPGTKMDGDNDGIPCESQFCGW